MGSVYLRDSSWIIKYKDGNGNWKRKSVGSKSSITKTMAREILLDIERKVKLGMYDMLDTQIPILKDFAKRYVKYQRDVKQKRSWERDVTCLQNLVGFFGKSKLSDIKAKDIDDYKHYRLKKVKAGTVNRELQVLRHLYNIATAWDLFFGKNPVTQAGLMKVNNQVERILTNEEERVLLDSSPEYLRNIIICALNTGMRKGEITTLKWEFVDLYNNMITIPHGVRKNSQTLRIPINTELRRLFMKLKLKSLGNEFVFLSSKNTPYKRHDSLNRAYVSARERANLKDLRFHDLRHTAGTRLGEKGVTVQAINKILGHADIRTTMRYVHPDYSLREAVEKLADSERDGHKSGHIGI